MIELSKDSKNKINIDLGCGKACQKGYIGLDVKKFNKDIKILFDLEKVSKNSPLPFTNNSIDCFYASHILEHLSNPLQIIEDCFRVLKPGGTLKIHAPYFAFPQSSVFIHKNFWNICGCLRILNNEYFEMNSKFSKVEWSYKWCNGKIWKPIEKIFDFIIRVSPGFYEKRLSRVFPIFEVSFICTK